MGKEWDSFTGAHKRDGQAERDSYRAVDLSRPGYGNSHGSGAPRRGERDAFIAFLTDIFTEARRVIKPGGHALVWALPRTSHWTATALEDAGWEIRDVIVHLTGQGFPKSLDVGKALDKMNDRTPAAVIRLKHELRARFAVSPKTGAQVDAECGFRAMNYLTLPADGKRPDPWINVLPSPAKWARMRDVLGCGDDLDFAFAEAEREVVGLKHTGPGCAFTSIGPTELPITAPATDLARQWDGWGTALKPAAEHWILARAPLSEPTVAANVARWGTGALNVDGCRIPGIDPANAKRLGRDYTTPDTHWGDTRFSQVRHAVVAGNPAGRWPPNVCLSHTLFCTPVGTRQVRSLSGAQPKGEHSAFGRHGIYSPSDGREGVMPFYTAPDGTETVEAWDCAEGCPVALLDAQSGVSRSSPVQRKRTPRTNTEQWRHGGERYNDTAEYGDTGGASRYFATFSHSDADPVSSIIDVEETEGQSCGAESIKGANTSAGKKTAGNDDNLHTDGLGNRLTDPSPMDTKFITETKTPLTTTSPISNALVPPGTITITNGSARGTSPLTVSSIDAVNGAGSIAPLPTSSDAAPAHIRDIASPVNPPTSATGEPATENATTPTCEPIGAVTRFRYCAKASTSERSAGLPAGERNSHPTVKSVALCRWLIRLICPPGGVVCDPFMGSGSIGVAAREEGVDYIGMDQHAPYVTTAAQRIGCEVPA